MKYTEYEIQRATFRTRYKALVLQIRDTKVNLKLAQRLFNQGNEEQRKVVLDLYRSLKNQRFSAAILLAERSIYKTQHRRMLALYLYF